MTVGLPEEVGTGTEDAEMTVKTGGIAEQVASSWLR